MLISVVAPCYNEQDVLPAFCQRVVAACEPYGSYELILIDDGSRDGTWPSITAAAEKNSRIVGIRLSRNHGHQLALTAGLAHAKGDRILIIDADLQDPPELLADMMALADQGADVVYGRRRHRAGESRFKLFTAHVFYRLLRSLSDVDIPEDTGDFRLINRNVLDVFNRMPEQARFIRGMISWVGFDQRPLLYDRQSRSAGSSKYPLRKMVQFAMNALTSFSTKPLRLASYLGLCVGSFCVLATIYLIFAHYLGYTVPGWTSLIVVILLAAALQLFVLGIIGEYLGRLVLESKGRPLFVVAEITDPARLSAPPTPAPAGVASGR